MDWKKVFKDKWSKWHIVRGFIVCFLLLAYIGSAPSEVGGFFINFTIFLAVMLLVTFPFLMELWDTKKVLYNDEERILGWSKFSKWIFTSEGLFDPADLFLDYVGYFIAILLFGFLFGF